MDGEVGRFSFQNYEALQRQPGGKPHALRPVFLPLSGKSWYRTQGFKELGYMHGVRADSYRKSTRWLNRMRHQLEGGTPSRSLQDSAQREGSRVLTHLERKRRKILKDHGFGEQGVPIKALARYQASNPLICRPRRWRKRLSDAAKAN